MERRDEALRVSLATTATTTDPDVIEIGASSPGKRSRAVAHVVLDEDEDDDDLEVLGASERANSRDTRPTKRSKRTKKTKVSRSKRRTKRSPTPPHVEPQYVGSSSSSGASEDDDERGEDGLFYCSSGVPPPSEGELDLQLEEPSSREREGFLSLRELEEANNNIDDTTTTTTTMTSGGVSQSGDHVVWRECAICLSRPTARDGAVVEGCYHTFCFVCIAHWAALNPACPLCKRRFNAILHDLRLQPGPAARLRFRRYSLADAAVAAGASLSPDVSAGAASDRRVERATPSSASRTRPDVAVGILQATSKASRGATSYGGPNASDTDVDRRRLVYARRLRAAPPPAVAAEKCSLELAIARRLPDVARLWIKLQPWVVRELQAVLEEDDVDLLVIMTRSLLDEYARQTLPLRRRATTARAATSADELLARTAWEGLRARLDEYLVDDAATFLHELFCFAVSACNDMAAYDSSVRYPVVSPT
jgi:E3 ubiquitin-protein ligase Topors